MTADAATMEPVQLLQQSLRGALLRPDDAGYDEARRVHNGMFDRRPDLVVRCAGVADVIAAVRFARAQSIPVAVKSGGHSVPGHSAIDGGMLIDLSAMRSVRVDPEARTARAEAGCLWGDLDHETQAFGLAVTGGQVSHTGIAGLTLGGGFGYLVRKYGFTIDSLLSVDMVTAEGELVHASEDENPDLFWGIRGGAGNFGIVTSFEFRLHPAGPIVYGGMMMFPISEARALLGFWRDFMEGAPDELTTQFVFMTAPPLPFVPEAARGTRVCGLLVCFLGTPEEGAELFAPLRAFRTPVLDMVGPIPYVIQQQLINDGVPHGLNYYTKGHFMTELTDEALDVIVEHAPTAPSPMSVAMLISLGGAAGRVPADATALAIRDARYSFDIISVWPDPSTAAENIAWTRDLWDAVRPYGSGKMYVNLLGEGGEQDVRGAYTGEAYRRLAELKKKYDPTNFFNRNANIAPSA